MILVRASASDLPPETARGLEGAILEPLRASRPVYRLIAPGGGASAVGKFFFRYPPASATDRGLVREYQNYLWAATLGLGAASGLTPRVLGRCPETGLGLLLEDVPGPDLDHLLRRAGQPGEEDALYRGLENLAGLLAFFHTRKLPAERVSPRPALGYLDKVRRQLQGQGLLAWEDVQALEEEKFAWEARWGKFPDRQVLLHGDATPTNFLFPDGRAVAVDLERLRGGDRLWDLSWVAGELKHAWGWRTGDLEGAETAIGRFFSAYLAALPASPELAGRLYGLNPFYMALAELRIARNAYLSWDWRRRLIAEARRCLYFGRRMS
jgi:aminoglycoside phosphotransferase